MNPNGTIDVTSSLRKVAYELLDLRQDDPDLLIRLEGASWLITYIADCLDVELQHAVDRGRQVARKQIEQNTKEYALEDREHPAGPNGVRDYGILNGDDI